ncbi:MAG: DoxX family protein [Bdellovibrionales bacterium]|nr:DoxX family protein [Bdellovibrionales bacterium]
MINTLFLLTVISGLAFLVFGGLCVFSSRMRVEFERYGLSKFRTLVGCLEVLGGLGVLLGHRWPPLMVFSAAGLAVLMLLGVGVRIKIKDSVLQTLPAALLFLVNAGIVWLFFESSV